MTFAEVRYQRRERGDQGQQGAEDWPDAQEGNVRSHLDYYHVTLLILLCTGIEDLHKVLQKLFICSRVLFCDRCRSLSSQFGPKG